MRDFGVVSARTILRITSMSPIRNFLPPSIVVTGDRLDATSEVYFNGVQVPEFVVSSSTRLIVRIPPSQVGKALKSLQAFASIPISQSRASLTMEIARPVRSIQGVDRLVQSWLLIFLTTPGSDAFNPQSGGGGRAIVGRVTERNGSSVAADLALSIERTKSELTKLQARARNVPLSEKLLSSDLESLDFDRGTGTTFASVSIVNMLGDRAQVSIR
jgi:hypothetical protein